MASHKLSRSALERLQEEHYDLTTRGRIDVANKIETARLLGDLSENGDYHAAKDEQGHMEGRIRQLEHLIEHAEIIETGDGDGAVAAGTIVTILYEGDDDDQAEQYLLGHPEETPPAGVGIMSLNSPLGTALVGKNEGDWVEYVVNGNALKVQIKKVELA